MENTMTGGVLEMPTAYDYRRYDQIWQRVSPDLNPYPDVRAAAGSMGAAPAVPATAAPAPPAAGSAAPVPVPAMESGGEADLPGAERDPCCMGTEAQESLTVLEGFLEEELAGRRCCLSMASRFRSQSACRLLRRIAAEKQAAVRDLSAAYYLITGACFFPSVSLEQTQWAGLAGALRSCYHQEACNGFNYQRAADEALDPCLQSLFSRLSADAYRRAQEIMTLLGQMLC